MEREYVMHFANFLKQKRQLLGLTQEELSQRVHVSKSAIAKWESSRGFPDRSNLRALSEVVDVPVDLMYSMIEGNDMPQKDIGFMRDVIAVLESYGYTVVKNKED